jgi:Family of unknown function (DUF5522)
MNEGTDTDAEPAEAPKFVEGRDYYFEGGLLVMTADYLRRRGYCCGNGCRNCPYDDTGKLK